MTDKQHTSNQTPVFSFRLPLDLRRELDRLSVEKDVTLSMLIVEILRAALLNK